MAGLTANPWLILLRERVPFLSYGVLTAGLSFAGYAFSSHPNHACLKFIAGLAGSLMFFIQLRLMDEAKDVEKDKVLHPERPLPRGVMSVLTVRSGIRCFQLSLYLGALAAAFFLNYEVSIAYIGLLIYLDLMYREFFMAGLLKKSPLLYALAHQIVFFPLWIFILCLYGDFLSQLNSQTIGYSLAVFASFFSYEICRKTNSSAGESYETNHGPIIVWLVILCLTALSFFSVVHADLPRWLILFQVALLLNYVARCLKAPGSKKSLPTVASLNLLAHIWSPITLVLGSAS